MHGDCNELEDLGVGSYDLWCSNARSLVPKACSRNFSESTTSSQGIHAYISLMATLKFTYSFN